MIRTLLNWTVRIPLWRDFYQWSPVWSAQYFAFTVDLAYAGLFALSKYLTMTIQQMIPIKCLRCNVISKTKKEKHIFTFIVYTNETQQTNKQKQEFIYLWDPYVGSVRWLWKTGEGQHNRGMRLSPFFHRSQSFSSHREILVAFILH